MKTTSHILRFFLPVILWAGVIFAFSSQPTGGASQIEWQDFIIKKSAHIFVYFVLSVLLYRSMINSGVQKKKAMYTAILLCMFYGVTDEFHQSFTPGREPTLRDVIIDTIGASLAIYYIWKLLPKAPPRLRNLAKNYQLS